MKNLLRLLPLFLLFLAPIQAQTITTQPANQSVQVGATATFSISFTGGPCRSIFYFSGVIGNHYGAYGPSPITYSVPNVTAAMNGTTVSVNLYGCTGSPADTNSTTATLTVGAPPPISLAVTGSILFDDATTVYTGPITIQQWNATTSAWVTAGTVATDVNGILTGTFIVDPNLQDASGNVQFQFAIPGATVPLASTTNTMPIAEFTQGSTGLTVTEVLFKAPFLASATAVSKSSLVSLTP
jgi:hypothetical protein